MESIRLTRVKADGETTKMIKDNFVFPKFLEAHWGTNNDFLGLCVTGAGMEKEKLLFRHPDTQRKWPEYGHGHPSAAD